MLFIRYAVVIVLVCASRVAAQDRLPPIPPEKLTDVQKKAVEEFKAARKADVTGPFVPLLRSPEVMNRARAMGDYLRYRSVLPPRLSEFVILLTSRAWTQNYEWSAHAPLALQAGINAETVAAIADGRRPDKMTEDEDVLYTFCEELRRNQSVSDATYARALGRFGEQGVVDTLGITGYYTFLAMVLNTARTPATTSALKPFPR
jgi:4-carboxymuconolactone decarboxylase